MANITPVFKKGNRSCPVNYRMISLTSICCKTLEHIIFHSIMEHLQNNNVLIENQHGFRADHSCQTQLISLVEDLLRAMDSQYQIDIGELEQLHEHNVLKYKMEFDLGQQIY